MFFRLMLSFIAMGLFGVSNFFINRTAVLVTGKVAGMQFDNSDTSYVVSQGVMSWFTGEPLSILFLLAALVAIWWGVASKAIKGTLGILLFSAVILGSPSAFAYYDKTDWTENVFILPNESAFFIPDSGANMNSQTKFGSEEYFAANKIPAKRFQIPHTKLANSGSWSDFYVPSGRLILIDRSPFNREWVDGSKGTSTKDEGFSCQSKEGITIKVGVAIGTSVMEENAAKFLYRFGVNAPDGDRNRPEVTFVSVYYGKSLKQVMDGPVRNMVQTLVCNEFSTRSFNDGNAQAGPIMTDIQNKTTAYLANYGITLDFIGWADTFTFDAAIQKSINDLYAANTVQPVLQTLERLADVKVKEGLGEGLSEHGLPSTLLNSGSGNLISGFANLVGASKEVGPVK